MSKFVYQTEIQQMMFTFGEVQDPIDETCCLVETIVKNQVIELISKAVQQAHRRGSRLMTPEDLIFLIRHDESKVNRLKSFLSWKDVRKMTKDKPSVASNDDEMLEDGIDKGVKIKKMRIKFSWDHLGSFSNLLDSSSEDDDDRQIYQDDLLRLSIADEITKNMTKEEYIYFAECRQASFTFKKATRFKEWSEMSRYYDSSKPNGDIIDTLGFLCHEAVGSLTRKALEIKFLQDASNKDIVIENHTGLFVKPPGQQAALKPIHILEAYRILQRKTFALRNFKPGFYRKIFTFI